MNSRRRIAAAAKGLILVKRFLALGRCLALGVSLIYVPRNALCFSLTDRRPEAFEFFAG